MEDPKESTPIEATPEIEAVVAKNVDPTMASRGGTILWLVVGIIAYIGIQWVMPKVGLNS